MSTASPALPAVLIVDDEPITHEFMRHALAQDCQYHGAADAAEALAYVKAHPELDLAMLDLTLPDSNGAELGRQLRQLRPALPLVVMSGYDMQWILESLGDLQVDEVLCKPFSVAALRSAVTKALKATR